MMVMMMMVMMMMVMMMMMMPTSFISDLPWNVDCEGIDDDDNDRNWQQKVLDSMSRTFSSKSDQFVISRYDRIEMSGPALPPTRSAIFPQFCQNFTFHKDLS